MYVLAASIFVLSKTVRAGSSEMYCEAVYDSIMN